MKTRLTFTALATLMLISLHGKAQTAYVINQLDSSQTANSWIKGKHIASLFQITSGTHAAGNKGIEFFAGTNTPVSTNLRWGMGLQAVESTGNMGSNFRIWRYGNDGAYVNAVFEAERNTGNIRMPGIVSIGNNSMIEGSGTGAANYSSLGFFESNRTTRIGYIGDGSVSNQDIYVSADIANLNFSGKTGINHIAIEGNIQLNAAGNVVLNNPTRNNIQFNAAGIGAPTFNGRSAGAKVTLWHSVPAANAAGWNIGIETNHLWFGTNTAQASEGFKWYGGTTEVARLDALGGYQVSGQGRFKGWYTIGTGPAAEVGMSSGLAIFYGYDRTANTFIPARLGGSELSFCSGTYSGFLERLKILSNGNIGIGVSNPSYKLTVNGVIAARKVKVTQETWADYVFDPNYDLISLLEVEVFVRKNRHLPEMPTEQEVIANGIDVGEMNMKLLKKIEELTLYLIEMKKELNELKATQK